MKILILGVNGFIGHSLTGAILRKTGWEVYGMDLQSDRLRDHLEHPRFHFVEGDISINHEWIEYHLKKCDVVLPLVAIATPKSYVDHPLRVFELDFEQNLRVVRQALRYETRVIFASSSEVYGMCPDAAFREDESPMVYGPISKQRWIYACSKQLIDRVIWAYGRHRGLRFTLFRPFNWIGPGLDAIDSPKEGSSRVVTQFLGHLIRREEIPLVDGGAQRRSFTFISDGVDGLMRIIANENGCADGGIFNLGNPENDCSIRELAATMIDILGEYDGYEDIRSHSLVKEVSSEEYYGSGYQDIQTRVPDITNARERLGWSPVVGLRDGLRQTIEHYIGPSGEPADRHSDVLLREARLTGDGASTAVGE